jgi:hypothetical protein
MSGTSSDRQPPLDPMAFFRRICISRHFIAIDPRTDDPTEDRKDSPCELRFTDKKSGICYRAIARYSEAFCNSNERDMEVMKNIFFEWAVPDVVDDLNGPILGESARVDGLQGCSPGGDDLGRTRRAARDDIALIAAEKDCALILWGYDGLGTLATLPLEVRCKVYERAFHRLSDGHFWQCYHTKRDGFSLLGISHSNPLPVIFSLSNAIRNEVLDSVYREQVAKIIIGGETVAFNFPLNAGLRPGESVDARLARVPLSKELFIGIQLPSQRNVERVVKLLSSMSLQFEYPFTPTQTPAAANTTTMTSTFTWSLSGTCVSRYATRSSSTSIL